jgi:hypothetical protein
MSSATVHSPCCNDLVRRKQELEVQEMYVEKLRQDLVSGIDLRDRFWDQRDVELEELVLQVRADAQLLEKEMERTRKERIALRRERQACAAMSKALLTVVADHRARLQEEREYLAEELRLSRMEREQHKELKLAMHLQLRSTEAVESCKSDGNARWPASTHSRSRLG